MPKLAAIAGMIISNIVDNMAEIVDEDIPVCPRKYNLQDAETCDIGCALCWTQALERA